MELLFGWLFVTRFGTAILTALGVALVILGFQIHNSWRFLAFIPAVIILTYSVPVFFFIMIRHVKGE